MTAPGRPNWPLVAALLALTAIVSSCATTLTHWFRDMDKPHPPIIRGVEDDPEVPGMKDDWDQRGAKLAARVQRKFPIGSPAEALRDELRSQGFSAEWRRGLDDEESASFTWGDFVCSYAAQVWWRVDARDRITSIRAIDREAGCL
jgi:hypothetical protein